MLLCASPRGAVQCGLVGSGSLWGLVPARASTVRQSQACTAQRNSPARQATIVMRDSAGAAAGGAPPAQPGRAGQRVAGARGRRRRRGLRPPRGGRRRGRRPGRLAGSRAALGGGVRRAAGAPARACRALVQGALLDHHRAGWWPCQPEGRSLSACHAGGWTALWPAVGGWPFGAGMSARPFYIRMGWDPSHTGPPFLCLCRAWAHSEPRTAPLTPGPAPAPPRGPHPATPPAACLGYGSSGRRRGGSRHQRPIRRQRLSHGRCRGRGPRRSRHSGAARAGHRQGPARAGAPGAGGRAGPPVLVTTRPCACRSPRRWPPTRAARAGHHQTLRVQGFQALVADQGGCGGLAADVLGALRDEYPRAPVLALPVRPSAGAAPGDADGQACACAVLPTLC